MSNGRFIKNTSWILAGQIVRMLISLLINIITTRYLGPSNYGVITYVTSFISFFTSVIGLGLDGIIIYELVNDREKNGTTLGTVIFMRLIVAVICTVSFLSLIRIIDGDDPVTMTVAVLQSIQLPFMCFDSINFWYQSRLESKYPVAVQTGAYIVTSVYKVILLATGKSVEWFGFAISLDIMVIGLAYLFMYHKHGGPRLGVSLDLAKRLLRKSTPFILANLMSMIYGQMDRIMIKQMLGSSTEVGLYSAALTICTIVGFIPVAILDSSRPVVMEAKGKDEYLYKLRFRQLAAAILWFSFLYSLGITVFSKLVIFILYGAAYLAADSCLKIAVWYTLFSYLGSAMNLWLICEKKNKYVFIFSCMGAVTNLLLNCLLIPRWGINGAAFATFISQLMTNFIFPILMKDTRAYSFAVVQGVLLRDVELPELVARGKQMIGKVLKR